jgi:NAD(P)H-dependent FMN reductase
MATAVRIVSLGGSLRAASTSRTALQAALDGAAAKGADVQLIWVRDLDLPLVRAARQFQTDRTCDYAEDRAFAADAVGQ